MSSEKNEERFNFPFLPVWTFFGRQESSEFVSAAQDCPLPVDDNNSLTITMKIKLKMQKKLLKYRFSPLPM